MTAAIETDEEFRRRILRVVDERDIRDVRIALAHQLDILGRKYGRFRYGVPLTGMIKPSAP